MRETRLCEHVNKISKIMQHELTTKINPLSSVKDIRVFGMMLVWLKMNCVDLVVKALKKD